MGNRWLYRQVLLAAMGNSKLSVKCQTKDRFDWSLQVLSPKY